jgi:hypothetical protein
VPLLDGTLPGWRVVRRKRESQALRGADAPLGRFARHQLSLGEGAQPRTVAVRHPAGINEMRQFIRESRTARRQISAPFSQPHRPLAFLRSGCVCTMRPQCLRVLLLGQDAGDLSSRVRSPCLVGPVYGDSSNRHPTRSAGGSGCPSSSTKNARFAFTAGSSARRRAPRGIARPAASMCPVMQTTFRAAESSAGEKHCGFGSTRSSSAEGERRARRPAHPR